MNKFIKHLLCLGFLGLSGSAYAEGGSCLSGYYPVGGQGAQGCAPIPNYNNEREKGGSQQPPQPTGYWVKMWGAIATSKTGGALGTVVGVDSQKEAEKIAMQDCKAKGGDGCKVGMSYHNQCAAMLVGSDVTLSRAESIAVAKTEGLKECVARGDNCRVYYSTCTEPRFVKY